ncbi:M56 family metallopeptidase [Paenibacillus methanolicus]|uniref:BlaR1 peptidase M56 n=1 Tax=Paenibacillus methanolicus TaxID=582686 RepID=A0A5S5BUT2_9BACL|nr:M56 family metallopeptidase [Paenibacillus methanolicus]TYP70749.1 BlaR1 peptidase M56 [Paenibacillus methanolicus]
MWNKHSKRLFWTCALPAALLLSQMVIYALHLAIGFELRFNLFQLCSSVVRKFGYMLAVYSLDAVVVSTLVMALAMMVRELVVARRTRRKLYAAMDVRASAKYNRLYGSGAGKIIVVRCEEPIAFTFGFRRPLIVLSTGLLKLLDIGELAAVIHHERFHQRYHDPVKTYLLHFFGAVLWYIPILRWGHARYKLTREILADRYAIERQGTPASLSGALVKMLRYGQTGRVAVAHVSFADTGVNQRIRQLLEPSDRAQLKVPLIQAAISAHVMAVLGALFMLACS